MSSRRSKVQGSSWTAKGPHTGTVKGPHTGTVKGPHTGTVKGPHTGTAKGTINPLIFRFPNFRQNGPCVDIVRHWD